MLYEIYIIYFCKIDIQLTCHEAMNLVFSDKASGSSRAAKGIAMALTVLSSLSNHKNTSRSVC